MKDSSKRIGPRVVLALASIVGSILILSDVRGFAPPQGGGTVGSGSAATQLDTIGSTQGQILYRNATTWTVLNPGTAGQVLQTGGAGANPSWGTITQNPFDDSTALVKGSGDATKLLRFEVDGFTTGNTRVATFPDQSFTLLGAFAGSGGATSLVSGGGGSTATNLQGSTYGYASTNTGVGALNLGASNNVSVDYGIAIGQGINLTHTGSIVIAGGGGITTATQQFNVGCDNAPISIMRVGKGIRSATPATFTLSSTDGTGAGIAGASIAVGPGLSGDAATASGELLWQVCLAGSGTTRTTAAKLTTSGALQLASMTSAAVSAAGTSALRSNAGTLQVSNNGGSWTDVATGTGQPFSDATALVKNASDTTKLAKFDASLISTGTTETFQFPAVGGKFLVNTSTINWPSGLGAITHVGGPGDQPLVVAADSTQTLKLKIGSTTPVTIGNLGTTAFVTNDSTAGTHVVTIDRAPGSSASGRGLQVTMGANTTGEGIRLDHNASTGTNAFVVVQSGSAGTTACFLRGTPTSNTSSTLHEIVRADDGSNAYTASPGGGVGFGGKYTSGGAIALFGGVGAKKVNTTDGNALGQVSLWANDNSAAEGLVECLRGTSTNVTPGTDDAIDLGNASLHWKRLYLATGIDTTAGDAATINKAAGRARKDTSGATFTVTNSRVTASSIVMITPCQVDATATSWGVAAGSGSFVVTFNAAPTANYDFNFVVINND